FLDIKSNSRPTTKCVCKARMSCYLQSNKRYKIVTFQPNHNHDLVRTPMNHLLKTKMLGGGGRPNLGFMDKDLQNYMYHKRMAAMKKRDAGVVCETNEYDRLFAPFVGVNHQKQTFMFCDALLYDETTKSFDKHRLSVWYIYQNTGKRLSRVFHGPYQLATDFEKCEYDHENEVEWLSAWSEMLKKNGLTKNKCLKDLFELRKKWQGYMRIYKLLHFFKHYERVLDDQRFKELTADFGMMHTSPVLSALKECTALNDYVAKRINKSKMVSVEYNVSFLGVERNHLVNYISANKTIHCNWMKFSFARILCHHALKVLAKKDVRRTPLIYILNRWNEAAFQLLTKLVEKKKELVKANKWMLYT
ncbi:hypothetical protein N665_0084s0027, partial [Sinapis alba]